MMSEIDKINVVFDDWKSLCKYYHHAFYEDCRLTDSCRHSENIPSGCSEGECKKDKCPFLNKINKKGDMND